MGLWTRSRTRRHARKQPAAIWAEPMADGALDALHDLSTTDLFVAARVEVGRRVEATPAVSALHARPTRQVFERAAALVSEHDPVDRELGAHVLRELGSDSFEPYPFRGKAVAILTARLENEHHPRVICAIVSALGFQHARESLDAVVRLRDHEDASVRLEVATALNGLVDAASPDSQSLTALRALADDTEAEVRYSALTTLVDDIAAPRRVVRRAARRRRRDPDQQVRRVARDYRRPRVRRRRLLIIVATGAAVVAQRRRP